MHFAHSSRTRVKQPGKTAVIATPPFPGTRVARQIFLGLQQRREPGQYEKLYASSSSAPVEVDDADDAPPSPGMPSSRERKVQQFKHTVSQIEKDLPRTFPNHPALDCDGREALGCVPSPCASFRSSLPELSFSPGVA